MNTPILRRRARHAAVVVLAVGASLVGATLATSAPASAAQVPAQTPAAQTSAASVASAASATKAVSAKAADKSGNGVARGIDVSGHQHPRGRAINFTKVRKAGYTYAFIKATEGRSFVNEYVKTDGRASQRAGIATGYYHFARPGTPAVAQARHFVNQVRRTGVDKPMLVLDLEDTDGRSRSHLRSWAKRWLQTVERMTGTRPLLYTGPGFWNASVRGSIPFAKYPLWVAHYETRRPTVPAPWRKQAIWQHSSTARVPGVPGLADVNVASPQVAARLAPPSSDLARSAKTAAAETQTSRSGERPAAPKAAAPAAEEPKVADARIEGASAEKSAKSPLPGVLLDALTEHA
ncbi:glycoside hydrolase family 25 protein, partial [Mumia zhuanghuii]|uniref:glycoside hydrolase family 25 protein n=1 Tax=Mumia zhuanghuii TaxID=2585211 RepID=UPI00362CA4E2